MFSTPTGPAVGSKQRCDWPVPALIMSWRVFSRERTRSRAVSAADAGDGHCSGLFLIHRSHQVERLMRPVLTAESPLGAGLRENLTWREAAKRDFQSKRRGYFVYQGDWTRYNHPRNPRSKLPRLLQIEGERAFSLQKSEAMPLLGVAISVRIDRRGRFGHRVPAAATHPLGKFQA